MSTILHKLMYQLRGKGGGVHFTKHMDRLFGNFDPPPPQSMWTLLLNSCY